MNEFKFNKGAYFLISWLRERYTTLVDASMYEVATRVYMLHLVGCNIIVDKSHVFIDAICMSLFTDFHHVNWVSRCATLTVLYTTLGEVFVFETGQLVGYISLF